MPEGLNSRLVYMRPGSGQVRRGPKRVAGQGTGTGGNMGVMLGILCTLKDRNILPAALFFFFFLAMHGVVRMTDSPRWLSRVWEECYMCVRCSVRARLKILLKTVCCLAYGCSCSACAYAGK